MIAALGNVGSRNNGLWPPRAATIMYRLLLYYPTTLLPYYFTSPKSNVLTPFNYLTTKKATTLPSKSVDLVIVKAALRGSLVSG